MSPTRDKFPLSPKKITKKVWSGLMVSLFVLPLFGSIFVAFAIDNGSGFLAILTVYVIMNVVLTMINTAYQKWYYQTYFYDLTDDHIIIRKGVWMPSEITIPYERVQDIYVDQDFFDRVFGIYDVHLSSATFASGISAHIDGLEKAAADGLKQELLTKVRERIGRKTN